jgi:hypothetical protein
LGDAELFGELDLSEAALVAQSEQAAALGLYPFSSQSA